MADDVGDMIRELQSEPMSVMEAIRRMLSSPTSALADALYLYISFCPTVRSMDNDARTRLVAGLRANIVERFPSTSILSDEDAVNVTDCSYP